MTTFRMWLREWWATLRIHLFERDALRELREPCDLDEPIRLRVTRPNEETTGAPPHSDGGHG